MMPLTGTTMIDGRNLQPFMRNRLALWGGLLALVAGSAIAQTYPTRPIRRVMPFAPGGTADINARAVAAHVERQLGGTIVIDNRDGANGIIVRAIQLAPQ
jgi:tripartite-type tricarboxylate transporter receptor subunit TctC